MSTNNLYRSQNTEFQIQSKLGLFTRIVRAYCDANQRTYLAATTDPETGRTDPATERQVAIMMLR
jgi:hypothetical protein